MVHWSERTSCLCGKTFKVGSMAEARHRHNFPLLCKNRKKIETELKKMRQT